MIQPHVLGMYAFPKNLRLLLDLSEVNDGAFLPMALQYCSILSRGSQTVGRDPFGDFFLGVEILIPAGKEETV